LVVLKIVAGPRNPRQPPLLIVVQSQGCPEQNYRLHFTAHRPILPVMKTKTRPSPRTHQHPELAPPGSPPHIAVASDLLDQEHIVAREDDDTDEDYEARCRLSAAVLRFARHG
jgi:hypothetical protein